MTNRDSSPDSKQMSLTLTTQNIRAVAVAVFFGFRHAIGGAFWLFQLDARADRNKEKKVLQRDIRKERLLNRESPARELENFAKRRSIERREQGGYFREVTVAATSATAASSTHPPRILERTVKCSLLNGLLFFSTYLFYNYLLTPLIEAMFFSPQGPLAQYRGGGGGGEWTWVRQTLDTIFSTFWLMPLFLLSKVVNALWFQDIADSAFDSSRTRRRMMSSVTVMLSDTILSVVVECLFLLQAKVCSFLPITILGSSLHFFHLCLLNSLYSFEYKWYNQGIELHRRLTFIEHHWPYFLGFGLPLTVLTLLPSSFVASGCVFSILFPLFIISGNQAQVVMTASNVTVNVFHPTILVSNVIFSKLLWMKKEKKATSSSQKKPRDPAAAQSHKNVLFSL